MSPEERAVTLLNEVDGIARDIDCYEYGLPIYSDGPLQLLVEAVVKTIREAVREERERAKAVYCGLHSGGCRMLSQGDACRCFLCQMDCEGD